MFIIILKIIWVEMLVVALINSLNKKSKTLKIFYRAYRSIKYRNIIKGDTDSLNIAGTIFNVLPKVEREYLSKQGIAWVEDNKIYIRKRKHVYFVKFG